MSYTPTNWKSGDIVSAEKLNKLEQGLAECCGGGTPLMVNTTAVNGIGGMITFTLDKTWQEIHDAFMNGTSVLINETNGTELVSGVFNVENDYTITVGANDPISLSTETADGHPQNVVFPHEPGGTAIESEQPSEQP